MKAVILTKPTESTEVKIAEYPTPAVKPGWVLVRIKSFGMNHSEQILRKSEISAPYIQKPIIPGIECVGEIADASDTAFTAGQKVIAFMGGMGREFNGSYAEYARDPNICATRFVLGCFGGLKPFIEFHGDAPDREEEVDIVVREEDFVLKRKVIPDGEAIEIAKRLFGDEFSNSIASMPREKRNSALQRLRGCGLSVRQVERLTGVGRGIIQKL